MPSPRTHRQMVTAIAVLSLAGGAMAQTRVGMPRANAGQIVGGMLRSSIQSTRPGGAIGGGAGGGSYRGGGGVHYVDGSGYRGGFVGGSGINISGSYTGDNTLIRFNIGTDGRHGGHFPSGGFKTRHAHHRQLFPWFWYPYRGYWDYPRGFDTPTVIVIENPMDAAVRTNQLGQPVYVPPPDPPTTEEIAAAAMQRGDYEEAVTRWRERLAEAPEDASAVRALGLAMALDGDLQAGTAMVAYAYQLSPELIYQPMPRSTFGTHRAADRALRSVVIYANSKRTDSAWLTVAMLMQMEDRDHHAARMIRKAQQAGLDEELAKKFLDALGQ
ncbi:MAG: tetratricopeptide repeat protein [Phycisphaerales bacterium JB039]